MRVTQLSLFQNGSHHVSEAYRTLFLLQGQLATGRRIQSAADDPTGAQQLLQVRHTLSRLVQVRDNAGVATSELSILENALQGLSDVLTRAREIAISGGNGTRTEEDRAALAEEVDELAAQVLTHLDARGNWGSVFGVGGSPSFSVGADGLLRFGGASGEREMDLGDAGRLAISLAGSRLLAAVDRGITQYLGSTGAAAGAGTDSARGSRTLTLSHTATTLGDGAGAGGGDSVSGLLLGSSSAGGDTVLGSSHQITINDMVGDGSGGNVRLNGGDLVAWTSSDTDLAVTGPNGEVVHLDFSAITAGFTGTVAVDAEGSMALDGGSAVNIDFASDGQAVIEGDDSTIFVDATGIRFAGDEPLLFPGTHDLHSVLVDLASQLRGEDELGAEHDLARIQDLLDEFDRIADHIHSLQADVGARIQRADGAATRATELELLFESRRSSIEDADLAELASKLTITETQLQASLSLTARWAQLPSLIQLL